MKFSELQAIAPKLIAGGQSRLLTSAPGRGKSEVVLGIYESIAKAEPGEWQYVDLFPATMTPADMMGYMVPREVDGTLISAFTLPPWMVTRDNKPIDMTKKVFLFVDEYDKADADVKKLCAELLLHKRIANHFLPKGSVVWAAANRSQDRSGSTKDFDYIINRRNQIEITDDLPSWERWATANGVNPVLIHFAKQNPNIVFSDGVPEKQGPWCTPRSAVLCMKDLEAIGGNGRIPTDGTAIELASGWIGEAPAAQLFSSIRLAYEMPAYSEIIRDPQGTMVPDAPDAQMLIAYQLAHRVTAKEIDSVITYIERMPKEFSVTFADAACRRDHNLIDTAAIGKWCANNSTLMAAIHQVNA